MSKNFLCCFAVRKTVFPGWFNRYRHAHHYLPNHVDLSIGCVACELFDAAQMCNTSIWIVEKTDFFYWCLTFRQTHGRRSSKWHEVNGISRRKCFSSVIFLRCRNQSRFGNFVKKLKICSILSQFMQNWIPFHSRTSICKISSIFNRINCLPEVVCNRITPNES